MGLGPADPGPGDGLSASWPGGHAPAGGFGLMAIAPQGGPDGPVVERAEAGRGSMRLVNGVVVTALAA